jgi:hypothetical protein
LLGSIIAALVVGALFDPVRHRIQRFVDGHLSPDESARPGDSEKAKPLTGCCRHQEPFRSCSIHRIIEKGGPRTSP